KVKYIECEDLDCIAEAIKKLGVRGAPALGVTAAFALAMTAVQHADEGRDKLIEKLDEAREYISKTRPTAVNLFWAMERIMDKARSSNRPGEVAIREALRIYQENKDGEVSMGAYGSQLIEDGDVILTHCNAGSLATAGIGTALGVIKTAWRDGKKIKVIADETRPLLQGARLTAFEMVEEGIPVTVIPDNTAAFVMRNHGITKVIVGADRIAANGDTANKIGTYGVAILAKEHGIPFYVAAPMSTIDPRLPRGKDIPIECRDGREIVFIAGGRFVPDGAETLNPAFDVTPREYISGIITEKGILRSPYKKSIEKALKASQL
ncbi:MAG: S-methyl-5-thioribose-1-phosphate isomerase, partial [Candidatus Hydrothermarchaeota archaeon]|nr:S-methyl-5-thioribose-1-phosphate isomerase [Candidatus Hydrothermarchaeota archaeon]